MTSTFHSRVNWAHHPSQQDKVSSVLSTLGQIISLSHNLREWTVEDPTSLRMKVLSHSLQWSSLHSFSLCWSFSAGDMDWPIFPQSCNAWTHIFIAHMWCGSSVPSPSPCNRTSTALWLFRTEREPRCLCKSLRRDTNSLSFLRNNSCIIEKQSFGKFIALPERKGVCLYFQNSIFSSESESQDAYQNSSWR